MAPASPGDACWNCTNHRSALQADALLLGLCVTVPTGRIELPYRPYQRRALPLGEVDMCGDGPRRRGDTQDSSELSCLVSWLPHEPSERTDRVARIELALPVWKTGT
jgi:hypothetical protein